MCHTHEQCIRLIYATPPIGDIDVLIVLADPDISCAKVMMQLLAQLVHDGFLLDELDWHKQLVDNEKSPSHRFQGVCRVDGGLVRRIDINIHPPNCRVCWWGF